MCDGLGIDSVSQALIFSSSRPLIFLKFSVLRNFDRCGILTIPIIAKLLVSKFRMNPEQRPKKV